jgi:uncharacterized protein YkwD
MKRSIALVVLVACLGVPVAMHTSEANGVILRSERLQALDREILVALNEARVARGLRPLTQSDGLEGAAVAHSRSMLEDGFFAHESRDGSPFTKRVRAFYPSSGYQAWRAGENLIFSTAELRAGAAIQAWLASPGHRRNMLDPDWREVGVGSLHARTAGGTFHGTATWVITVDFGARSGKVAANRTLP